MNYIVSDIELTSIAEAIRLKAGTTDKIIFPTGFVDEIGAITGGIDTSDATATAADILDGKSAYVNGEKVIGTFVPDGYQLMTGQRTVSEPGLDLFFEDLPFVPEGAFIYHVSGQNVGYSPMILYGYGTTENRYNVALARSGSGIATAAFYVDWYEGVLSLTAGIRFNGPYGYIIWGK